MATEDMCPPPITTTTPTMPADGICASATWNPNGVTVAGGNGAGSTMDKFDFPSNLFVDDDDNVYVADTFNHRVVKWMPGASASELVIGGNMGGNHSDQLNYPADFVIDKNGTIFICDAGNRRIQRWYKNDNQGYTIIRNISCGGLGIDNEGLLYVSDSRDKHRVTKWPGEKVVAGDNGEGNALNQLSNPSCIFIDQNKTIFIADVSNHRVVKWPAGTTEGNIVAGGNGYGHELNQLYQPESVVVDQMGTVYVAEYQNHRVTRWFKDSKTGIAIIGGRGEGDRDDQLRSPTDLAFDRYGNLFVADYFNNRIQKFVINKSSCKTSHFEKNLIN